MMSDAHAAMSRSKEGGTARNNGDDSMIDGVNAADLRSTDEMMKVTYYYQRTRGPGNTRGVKLGRKPGMRPEFQCAKHTFHVHRVAVTVISFP